MSKKGSKKGLFIVEIIVLIIFLGGLFVYGQVREKLDKIKAPAHFDTSKVEMNKNIKELKGYTNYALFGLDTRKTGEFAGDKNSDTIIIASLNNETKKVRLVSVYRDTLLNIGDNTYAKANAAYAYGGVSQAISMLNTNLDLNIKDYVTVDFSAVAKAIDVLGGLDIPMSYEEIVHMNNYCVETSKQTGLSYKPIELPDERPADQSKIIGTYHLNGVQATSYCRIRYTSSLDMGRTERQRRVIELMVQKAKKAGLPTIFKLMDEVFPLIETSISKEDLISMATTLMGYSIGDTQGFPKDFKFSNVKGSVIVPTTLKSNVEELHKFLFGENVSFTPSSVIEQRSEKILEIVGGENKLDETQAPSVMDDTNDNQIYWQDNGTQDNQSVSEPTSQGGTTEGNQGTTQQSSGVNSGGNSGGNEDSNYNQGHDESQGGNEESPQTNDNSAEQDNGSSGEQPEGNSNE